METKKFQEPLIQWYKEHKRKLPFREDQDPYKIWISEIMAQQTRIEAMLPYFDRFIQELPDIPSLASVSDEKLHKLWQVLGYYNRCKNLKKCAQVCMDKYAGHLPVTKEELMTLPGIGPYTAGAIASIAFDQKVSAIDGNVNRVFARLYDIRGDIKKSATQKEIAHYVEESLVDDISSYNQALMELGALICIPKSARCLQCPISMWCKAYKKGVQNDLPVISKSKPRKIVDKDIYVLVCDNKIHIQKREEKGLLEGLYEFDEICPEKYYKIEPLEEYTHIFSHVEWRMKAYLVYVHEYANNYYSVEEIEREYALPSAFLPFFQQVKEKLK